MRAHSRSNPAPRRMLWGLLAVSAITIALVSVPALLVNGQDGTQIPLGPDPEPHYASLLVHAIPGGAALILGPVQFVTRLRVRHPRLHRITGRLYVVSVLAGAVAAVVAAVFSASGFTVQVAFLILAVAWLYTLARAYRSIRRGEVRLHRIWMIRNYSLTFAAVTLRIYLFGGIVLSQTAVPSLTIVDVYNVATWASILGNVLVAEYVIVHRLLHPPAHPRPRTDPGALPASPGLGGPVDAEPARS